MTRTPLSLFMSGDCNHHTAELLLTTVAELQNTDFLRKFTFDTCTIYFDFEKATATIQDDINMTDGGDSTMTLDEFARVLKSRFTL